MVTGKVRERKEKREKEVIEENSFKFDRDAENEGKFK